jgi:hypothetical protein
MADQVNGLQSEENGGIRDDKGRFLPGNPGGPGRKPGSVSLLAIIRKKLEEYDETEKRTVADKLADQYIHAALNPSMMDRGVAFRDLLDRLDGKPHQTITVDSAQDEAWLEFLKSVRAEPESEADSDTQGLLEDGAETADP